MERINGYIKREANSMAKINVSLSPQILDEIDQARRDLQIGRSEFLRRASLAFLEAIAAERRLREKREAIGTAIKIQNKIAEELGDWDAEGLLRKWRDSRK
jgi:metal-responsive CopG/Arc/MetJ family transcriptional regulator